MKPKEHIRTADEYDHLLRGLIGYISWSWDHDMPTRPVLANVLHDLAGTLLHDPTFLPRTKRFASYKPRPTNVPPPIPDDEDSPDPADLIV